jgi:helix-turn-helix, Psq domain
MPQPNNTQLMQREGRIALAMDALKRGHFASVRDAAKSYDLVYTTLQRHVNGRLTQYNSRPTNCKLIDIEESTLV